MFVKVAFCLIIIASIFSTLPVGAYAPPTEGEGSGKPSQTWGSGTRSLKFWEFILKAADDRGSGR